MVRTKTGVVGASRIPVSLACEECWIRGMPGCILVNSRGVMEVYCRVREYKNHLCVHAQAFVPAAVVKETGQSAKQSGLISSRQSEATGSLR